MAALAEKCDRNEQDLRAVREAVAPQVVLNAAAEAANGLFRVGQQSLGEPFPTDHRSPFRGFPLPVPDATTPYPGPPALCVAELVTKTCQDGRAPPIMLPLDADERFCFVRTLARFDAASGAPDVPASCAIQRFWFKKLTPDRGMLEEPLSSSALGARVRCHLMRAGLYAGEATHSLRRGRLQLAAAQGADQEALLELGQIKSPGTLALYLDTERHVRGRAGRGRTSK
ncbi:hypothetical protein TSOC_002654 [Tetrabaena socialis]|uniref:Uncharacterized protein n=1 Tax=Tetrabaena socialis TaxID=47790 RepID=A0A2J8ADK9_9CHLO|nr:hypothetical protein TSOC_002654 [Tetrabaena socialis]|eukprot:PNH10603.1 hypothetical protein TSOC_002654 [Tetrabaena socialis]